MKIKTGNILTGILVICVVIVTFLFLRKEFAGKTEISYKVVDNWEELIPADEREKGSISKAYLIEFFDYECPYCNVVDTVLDSIQSKYDAKIKIVRYHFPLNMHPSAYKAAIAAECARDQGMFESYHKELMKNQYRLSSIDFNDIAILIGIKDLNKFQMCIDNEEPAGVISRNVQLAKRIGVNGTPTLIINNKMISGVIEVDEIDRIIKNIF